MLVFIGSVQAEDFGMCGYTPKKAEQHQYPEWGVFDSCASYDAGVLRISQEHRQRLYFGTEDLAVFFYIWSLSLREIGW